jgi:hypothetical protein
MKTLLFIAGLIFLSVPALAEDCGNIEPGWTACSQDTDCVAISGVCGGWTAVNKSFEKAARDRTACLATMVDCAISNMNDMKPDVKCINAVCAAAILH